MLKMTRCGNTKPVWELVLKATNHLTVDTNIIINMGSYIRAIEINMVALFFNDSPIMSVVVFSFTLCIMYIIFVIKILFAGFNSVNICVRSRGICWRRGAEGCSSACPTPPSAPSAAPPASAQGWSAASRRFPSASRALAHLKEEKICEKIIMLNKILRLK